MCACVCKVSMQDCIQFQSQPSHHHASLWCLIPASISTANQSTKPSIHSVLKFCWESIYLYIIAIWYIYNRRAQVKQLASIFCQKKKKKSWPVDIKLTIKIYVLGKLLRQPEFIKKINSPLQSDAQLPSLGDNPD